MFYSSTPELPAELLKTVTGIDLCRDEAISLLPLQNFQNKDISDSSTRLIEKSNTDYNKEFRLNQVWNVFYTSNLLAIQITNLFMIKRGICCIVSKWRNVVYFTTKKLISSLFMDKRRKYFFLIILVVVSAVVVVRPVPYNKIYLQIEKICLLSFQCDLMIVKFCFINKEKSCWYWEWFF